MRGIGPIVSFGGHAVLLFWGLVSFAPEPLEADFSEALPVEFVTISEVRDLTKGSTEEREVIDSEETVKTPDNARGDVSETPGPQETPVEEAKPVPVDNQQKEAVEVAEEPAVSEPVPETVEPKEVAETRPVPKPPLPRPDIQPKPVEVAKVEPQEVKPEPVEEPKPVEEKDPLADLIDEVKPEPEPEKKQKNPEEEQKTDVTEEQKTEATPPSAPPSAPAPRLNPRPKIKTAAVRPELLNKKKAATNAGGKPKKKASVGTKTGRQNAKLEQTELDGLRDAIQKCWALPPGYSAGQDFRAKVKTRLTRDGRVDGRVQILSVEGFQGGPSILIKNAVKVAIEKCQPYKLPASKYAQWQNLTVTFYP